MNDQQKLQNIRARIEVFHAGYGPQRQLPVSCIMDIQEILSADSLPPADQDTDEVTAKMIAVNRMTWQSSEEVLDSKLKDYFMDDTKAVVISAMREFRDQQVQKAVIEKDAEIYKIKLDCDYYIKLSAQYVRHLAEYIDWIDACKKDREAMAISLKEKEAAYLEIQSELTEVKERLLELEEENERLSGLLLSE